MNTNDFVTNELSKIVGACPTKKYGYAYHLKKIQRYLFHTVIAFFLQYLMIISLPMTGHALPIYPPLGAALMMIYFLGDHALLGLLLGGGCAYFFKGLAPLQVVLFLTADIGCGYLGVRLCQSVFSSERSLLTQPREWFEYLKINALITCTLSSLLQLGAILFNHTGNLSAQTMRHTFIQLWLSDVNAILVFSAFFLSWTSVYLGMEKIAHAPVKKLNVMMPLLCILVAALLFKPMGFMLIVIASAIYLSVCYGFLIATSLSYGLSLLFLVYFINHPNIQNNTIVPWIFLLIHLIILHAGQRTSRRYFGGDFGFK